MMSRSKYTVYHFRTSDDENYRLKKVPSRHGAGMAVVETLTDDGWSELSSKNLLPFSVYDRKLNGWYDAENMDFEKMREWAESVIDFYATADIVETLATERFSEYINGDTI